MLIFSLTSFLFKNYNSHTYPAVQCNYNGFSHLRSPDFNHSGFTFGLRNAVVSKQDSLEHRLDDDSATVFGNTYKDAKKGKQVVGSATHFGFKNRKQKALYS